MKKYQDFYVGNYYYDHIEENDEESKDNPPKLIT
jgi:hypothetical protein